MIIHETDINGVYLCEQTSKEDHRGFFARWYCSDEMKYRNLNYDWAQMNNSASNQKYTLRGLHFQVAPSQEVKFIRCINGEIWDVVVDLRPQSYTFGKWAAFNLSSKNRHSVYVPQGCAHGFLTLTDKSEIIYLVSSKYDPASERTLLWNDKTIGIKWPSKPHVISEKDKVGTSFGDLKGNILV